jgi:hypothetical protein
VVQILYFRPIPAAFDLAAQFIGQFALLSQRYGQLRAPFLKFLVKDHSLLNGTSLSFTQASSSFLAIADNEGGRSTCLEEFERSGDRRFRQSCFLDDMFDDCRIHARYSYRALIHNQGIILGHEKVGV